jgi:hypothetical protein
MGSTFEKFEKFVPGRDIRRIRLDATLERGS